MADDATKHLFVLGFPDAAAADARRHRADRAQRDQFLDGSRTTPSSTKAADGKLDRQREQGRRSGRPPRRA